MESPIVAELELERKSTNSRLVINKKRLWELAKNVWPSANTKKIVREINQSELCWFVGMYFPSWTIKSSQTEGIMSDES